LNFKDGRLAAGNFQEHHFIGIFNQLSNRFAAGATVYFQFSQAVTRARATAKIKLVAIVSEATAV
jgi:hypothetical protein